MWNRPWWLSGLLYIGHMLAAMGSSMAGFTFILSLRAVNDYQIKARTKPPKAKKSHSPQDRAPTQKTTGTGRVGGNPERENNRN